MTDPKDIEADRDETNHHTNSEDTLREYGVVSFEMDIECDDHPRTQQLAKQLEIDFINKDL